MGDAADRLRRLGLPRLARVAKDRCALCIGSRKGGPKAALSRRAERLVAHAGQSAALASRKSLILGFAPIVDIGGLRLEAGGDLSQQVKDLRVPVLRDQPFDIVSPAPSARLTNDRHPVPRVSGRRRAHDRATAPNSSSRPTPPGSAF
jgi:hypothetical protein